ncbi:MAG: hypothetical protein ACMUHM_03455 [Thermoplasmatota archaeon]
MVDLYLTSRAEILRKVNMDTGRRIALVDADPDFVRWMEKLLPSDSCIVGEPDELLECSFFDIIIYWEKEEVRMDRIERLIELLSNRGDLWIILKHGKDEDLLAEKFSIDQDNILNLTPERDLVPLVVRCG